VSADRANARALRGHVEALEGERHWARSPERIARARGYVLDTLRASGWQPLVQPFTFAGRTHENITALSPGADPALPRALVGAHLDTVPGTPGADDNASGVAGVLETARILAARPSSLPVELAVWDLEERTAMTYRVGSRHRWPRPARQGCATPARSCSR